MDDIYKNKYIKYKNKYIKLKSQLLIDKQKKWPRDMLSLIHQNGTNYINLSNKNKNFVKSICNKCGYKFDETENFCKVCYKLKIVNNHKKQNILNINMTKRKKNEKSEYIILKENIYKIRGNIYYLEDDIDQYNNNIKFYNSAFRNLEKNIIIKEPRDVTKVIRNIKLPPNSTMEDKIEERYEYFNQSIKINKERLKESEKELKLFNKNLLSYKSKYKELLEKNKIDITKDSYN